MAQAGTPVVQEKEYTFTTPLAHGLSYKKVNPDNAEFKFNLAHCWEFIERSAERGNKDLIRAEDIADRVIKRESDLWVSTDESGDIVGCVVIGAGTYPGKTGIFAEAIGGKFDFSVLVPMLEKFYKNCGYQFFEMTGRKGWERKMKPLGYKYMNTTIYKRL
jgi:hypothetical protein